jgi:hypothetical protein
MTELPNPFGARSAATNFYLAYQRAMPNTVEEALDSNSNEITISYNEGPPASGKSEYLRVHPGSFGGLA